MGRIIAVVGNAGVGKTTLARRLAQHRSCAQALESHAERPFHRLCREDPHGYAFANQADFLLYRAEQEALLRSQPGEAVVDGGLDLDFHGFTCLFHQKGYLSAGEFDLCGRLYHRLRAHLPPPEVIVLLHAPIEVVQRRFAERARPLELTRPEDLPVLESCLARWLDHSSGSVILRIDAASADPEYREALAFLDLALGARHPG